MNVTANPEDKSDNEDGSVETAGVVGKLDLRKAPVDLVTGLESLSVNLTKVVRLLCRLTGTRKSAAAIRDSVGYKHDAFGAAEAVAALSNLGYKASFGSMRLSEITDDMLPLLAFKGDETAVIITQIEEGTLTYLDDENIANSMELGEFQQQYSGYAILSVRMSSSELKAATGHWFYSAFRRSKWLYIQVLMAALISNFLGISSAIFTMTVYDRIIPNNAIESLYALTVGVGIALGFDYLIKQIRARFIEKASKSADLEISTRLFNRILNLTPREQSQKTGKLAGTIKEFETLREFFNSSTVSIVIDLPFIVLFLYIIYLVGGPLAYVPMSMVPVVLILALGVQPFLASSTKQTISSGMDKQSVLVEALSGIETINATGSGNLMKKRYQSALEEQADTGNRMRSLTSMIVNLVGSVVQVNVVLVVFVGVFLITSGEITQGSLIAVMILSGRVMQPLSQLAMTLSKVNSAVIAYRNLNNLFSSQSQSSEMASPLSRPTLAGEIEFKNVTFTFDGASQPAIKNISFKIPAGQKVAIIGKMGSGKSTLSKLVAGMYHPDSGAVLIDGVDVRQIDKADLRNNVGIMLQESWLFSGTVRENIQLSNYNYDDDHLLRVCKLAGVDDFIGSNPKGYELEIKERGVGLSGGQRQAINLARSLICDPNILLLDEPTSAMDQTTEQNVVKNLQKECSDKTMLIVTHRNPILTMVDRILVIDNGSVVADKKPEELGIKV